MVFVINIFFQFSIVCGGFVMQKFFNFYVNLPLFYFITSGFWVILRKPFIHKVREEITHVYENTLKY